MFFFKQTSEVGDLTFVKQQKYLLLDLNCIISVFTFLLFCLFVFASVDQDGEEWIFTVRKLDSLPERTTVVNYDGFAEGILSLCF